MDSLQVIEKCKEIIENINIDNNKNYIEIEFSDVISVDPELASILENNYDEFVGCLKHAYSHSIKTDEDNTHKQFMIKNLPSSMNIPIGEIRKDRIDKFAQYEGTVLRTGEVKIVPSSIRFECPSCGNLLSVLQGINNIEHVREPTRCGCGRQGKFKTISIEWKNIQYAVIEEYITDYTEKKTRPTTITILLEEELTNEKLSKKIQPGKHIIFTGKVIAKQNTNIKKNLYHSFQIVASHVKIEDINLFNLPVPEKYIEQFKGMDKDNIIHDISESLFHNIEGQDVIKEILAVSRARAVKTYHEDGKVDMRDTIYPLLIGDPGCLPKGTKIHTAHGLKQIQDIKVNEKVKTIDNNGDLSYNPAFSFYSGKKQIYTINYNNECIKCSGDHKWFILRNGSIRVIQTKNLNNNDYLLGVGNNDNKKMFNLWQRICDLSKSKKKILFQRMLFKNYISKTIRGKQQLIHKPKFKTNQGVISNKKIFSNENSKNNEYGPSRDKKKIKRNGCQYTQFQRTSKVRHIAKGTNELGKTKRTKWTISAWQILRRPFKQRQVCVNCKTNEKLDMRTLWQKQYENGSGSSSQKPKQQRQQCKQPNNIMSILPFKITSIIKEKQKVEMYDLYVNETHNFILENGVISHNSGKSDLAKQAVKLDIIWLVVSGKASSGVGITASVIRDQELGCYTVEPGAIVRTSGHSLFLDELDKVDEGNLASLNEAMTNLSFTIAKANQIVTLPADCNLIGALNPDGRKWDNFRPRFNQIPLKADFLDRFDIWIAVEKIVDTDKQKKVISKIINRFNTNNVSSAKYDFKFLRYYYAWIIQTFKPKINEDMADYAMHEINKLMNQANNNGENSKEVSYRLVGNIIRFAIAISKLRQEHDVTKESIDRAIYYQMCGLKSLDMIDKETGLISYEKLNFQTPVEEKKKKYIPIEIIKSKHDELKRPVLFEEIFEAYKESYPACTEHEFEDLLIKLKNRGDIFEPSPGKYNPM